MQCHLTSDLHFLGSWLFWSSEDDGLCLKSALFFIVLPLSWVIAAQVLVRRFSTTSGVVAVHVDAWSSLTSQYHLGSPELSGGVRDNFVQVRGFMSRSTKVTTHFGSEQIGF